MTARADLANSARTRRLRAFRFGVAAEWVCVARLRLAGWRILARRYKTPLGEVDIIARRGDVLAFVEVKARPSSDEALEAVTSRQQRRITAAAKSFLAKNPRLAQSIIRFDVMAVSPWGWPRHIPNAWMAE